MAKNSCFKRIVFITLLVVLMASSITLCGLIVNNASAISGSWNDSGNYTVTWLQYEEQDGVKYYLIKSEKDLASTNHFSGYYYEDGGYNHLKLCADLDMSAHYWAPRGTFKGTFDGNGHTISGIKMQAPGSNSNSSNENAGLFQQLDGATIENITLDGFTIYSFHNAGALAAKAENSTLTNINVCGARVRVANRNEAGAGIDMGCMYSGGMIGGMGSCQLTNCMVYNTDVYIANTNSTVGKTVSLYCGGIVGRSSNSNIECCATTNYNQSNVVALLSLLQTDIGKTIAYDLFMGGIAGRFYSDNSASITNCFNRYEINGGNQDTISTNFAYLGGIAGKVENASITACYNMGNVSGYAKYTDNEITLSGKGNRITTDTKFFDERLEIYYGPFIKKNEPNNYVGGIVGYCSGSISNCYNTGNIDKNNSIGDTELMLHFYWYKTSDSDRIAFKASFTIGQNVITVNDICGNHLSSDNISKCFTNSSIWGATGNKSFTMHMEIILLQGKYKIIELSEDGWSEGSFNWHDSIIYMKSTNGNITIDGKGKNNDNRSTLYNFGNYVQAFSTDCNGFGDSSICVDANHLSSTYYAVDPKINGGLPHLKCFYWQDNASI